MATNATLGARARARAEITAEIKAEARRQLAESGSAGLSLRAVARSLGMVSSALYRYFPSRDDLLTALIIDAYDAVGAVAEAAAGDQSDGVEQRFLSVAKAVRRWALANPHDYALVYGSPVPGYKAPSDTIPAAQRVSFVPLAIVVDGVRSGEIDTNRSLSVPKPVHADLAAIRDQVAPGVPDEVLGRMLLVWTQLFGSLSFELFGHLHRVIDDYDAFFDHQVRRAIQVLLRGTSR